MPENSIKENKKSNNHKRVFKKDNPFVSAVRKPGKKAGSVCPERKAAFFCLDFSLLLSFDQAKESKDQSTGVGIKKI